VEASLHLGDKSIFFPLQFFYRPVYIDKIGYATIQAQGGSVHDNLEITADCIDVPKHGRNRLHAAQQRAGHGRHIFALGSFENGRYRCKDKA
jgi:hypothetical protein